MRDIQSTSEVPTNSRSTLLHSATKHDPLAIWACIETVFGQRCTFLVSLYCICWAMDPPRYIGEISFHLISRAYNGVRKGEWLSSVEFMGKFLMRNAVQGNVGRTNIYQALLCNIFPNRAQDWRLHSQSSVCPTHCEVTPTYHYCHYIDTVSKWQYHVCSSWLVRGSGFKRLPEQLTPASNPYAISLTQTASGPFYIMYLAEPIIST